MSLVSARFSSWDFMMCAGMCKVTFWLQKVSLALTSSRLLMHGPLIFMHLSWRECVFCSHSTAPTTFSLCQIHKTTSTERENPSHDSLWRATLSHVCALDLCRARGGKVARKGAGAQLADGGPPTRDRSKKVHLVPFPSLLESNTPARIIWLSVCGGRIVFVLILMTEQSNWLSLLLHG
jgi:hypothetical protein